MTALGRGLASLIPKRQKQDAEDVLERIDSMEMDDNTTEPADRAPQAAAKKSVSVIEEFEQLDDGISMPMPVKPNVTPLEMDPAEVDEILQEAKQEKVTAKTRKKASVTVVEEDADEGSESTIEAESEIVVEEETITQEPEVPVEEEAGLPAAEREAEAAPVSEAPVRRPSPKEEFAGDVWDRHEEKVQHISIGDIIINPLQPRRSFDKQEMEDLMQSIDQHGILQPLVVRRLADDAYELIAGERRLRAVKQLKWDRVPCVVRTEVKGDESRLVYALIENLQRENLNPVEEAEAYRQLNEEYGLTHDEIGERMGKSRVAITNVLRVLQLPAEIQRGLAEGKITAGHAKAILMIPDPEKQVRFYQHMVDEGLTVRKAEIRARRIQRVMKVHDPMRKKTRGRHTLALKYSPALEERYGFDANVKFIAEKNRFEVHFKAYSESEIQQLLNRLLGTEDLPEHVDDDIFEDDEE